VVSLALPCEWPRGAALFARLQTNGDDRDAVAGFFELALEELGQTGSSVAGC
jgi:hypothetical protein